MKQFRNIASDINVKHKKSSHKQKMVFRLITDTKYILQLPSSWTVSYQETRSPAKWSSFSPEWKEEKCHPGQMNDRWVISIYEAENAHMDLLSCLSDWNVFACVRLCVRETKEQKNEKRVRGCRDEILFSLAALCFCCPQIFHSRALPCPHLPNQHHFSFTLLTT